MRQTVFLRNCVTLLSVMAVQICAGQTYEEVVASAQRGDPVAQSKLGYSYERGANGMEQSDSMAFLWYKKSADQGYSRAQDALASMYEEGRGTEQDYRQAYLYYRRAADQGIRHAMNSVGICYELGLGVAKDLRQAAEWNRRAVEAGSRRARNDTARVNEKYFLQCKQSVEKGETYMLRDLGLCYEQGIGVAGNMERAREIYQKAVDSNVLYAADDLARVEATLVEDANKDVAAALPPAPPAPSTPLLKVTSFELDGEYAILQKQQPFTLTLNLENVEMASAEEVSVKLDLPEGVLLEDGQASVSYATVDGKARKPLKFELLISKKFSGDKVPLKLTVKEKLGQYAEDWSTTLALGQKLHQTNSDIEEDIPVSDTQQPSVYALIISEENYSHVAAVPYSISDGKWFREYCIKTLGIPEGNVIFNTDVTKSEIMVALGKLEALARQDKKAPALVCYFSGHGVPDKASHSAHLLPIDGFAGNAETGISLQQFYARLNAIATNAHARRVSVFLDACFSGHDREGGMVEDARGVEIDADGLETAADNMVVFSASKGVQSAYSYQEQQHGLFTYFLLKKIKDSQGKTTYKEIFDYLEENVGKTSVLKNDAVQTPSVSGAPGWETWTLR